MKTVEATPQRVQQFAGAVKPDAPVIMLNLLRYRAQASFPPGSADAPCSGREAYRRYAAKALACVQAAGGRPLFGGKVAALPIAPDDEHWDDMLLVEYPSPQAFLQMVGSPEYRAVAHLRTAALEDSRLIAIQGDNSFQL
ncbi:MAG: DUF1330 domain-containing protein [Nevskia sp.]|nr:DUF1330 domain-containing protein [Nevskia sp.]